MLSKLLKHEFRSTGRCLSPLYMILLLFTVMYWITSSLDIFPGPLIIIPGFITFFYVLSIMSIVIVTIVLLINRFYKNLIQDEGYLMFTLPVKTHQLINSKLLTATVWIIISIVAMFFSLCFADQHAAGIVGALHEIQHVFMEANAIFGNYMPLFVIENIVFLILGIMFNILLIYASVAIGQLFASHKILGSFAGYMGITTILQFLAIIGFAILAHDLPSNIKLDTMSIPTLLYPILIFVLLILSAAFYWITHYIFSNKLNLE